MGDEGFGYEDEAAGEEAYYLRQMEKETQKNQKVYKREPTEKELREKKLEEEFEAKKAKGMAHLTGDKLAGMGADEERLKAKKKAAKIAEQEEEEIREAMEKAKLEKIQAKLYKKSSEYKRKKWEEKREVRYKYEAEWEAIESAHNAKKAEFDAEKEQMEKQKRIDQSWFPKQPRPESASGGGGGAKGGAKGKGKPGKGKAVDLSRFGAVSVAAMAEPKEEEPVEKELPWDPETDKDPKRPLAEKKAEKEAWSKREVAWKKELMEWSKQKQANTKEVARLKELRMYDSEPEFKSDVSDSDSDDSDDSDSDSDF